MLKYTARKLLALIPKLLVIMLICFLFMELLPGDALSRTMDPMTYNELTEAQREAKREEMGLNDPAPIRFFRWLFNVIRGDLGVSAVTGEPVKDILAVTMKFSMELTAWALVLSTIIGIIAGFITAVFKNTVLDYTIGTVSIIGISLPEFFFGLMFIIIFCLKWPIGLPSSGRMPPGNMDPTFWERVPYMILPIATLVFNMVAGLQRYTRTTMLDVLSQDYIRTARAKGLSRSKIYYKHALKNTLSIVGTMIAGSIAGMIGGASVTEKVFNIQGMGTLTVGSLGSRDYPQEQAIVLFSAFLFLFLELGLDIMYKLLDPRIEYD